MDEQTLVNRMMSLPSLSSGLAHSGCEPFSQSAGGRGRPVTHSHAVKQANQILHQAFFPTFGRKISDVDLLRLVADNPILAMRMRKPLELGFAYKGPWATIMNRPKIAVQYYAELSDD